MCCRATLSAALLLGSFVAACLPPSAQAMPADQLFARLSPSVWVVAARSTKTGSSSTGSAVVTAPETMVTNCHVLRGSNEIRVHRERVSLAATLQYPDVERDLCQLHVPGLVAPAVPIQRVDRLAVGQKVYAIGAPIGMEATLSDGLISSIRRNAAGQAVYIQTSAPISSGSSGGGLFDEEGWLVGITSEILVPRASTALSQNVNLARPAEQILELASRGKNNIARFNNNNGTGDGTQPLAEAPRAELPPVASIDAPPAAPPMAPPVAAPAAPQPAYPPSYPPGSSPTPGIPQVSQNAPPAPTIPPGVTVSPQTAETMLVYPYRTARMEQGLEVYMSRRIPKAFVVASNGKWAFANGRRPTWAAAYADDVSVRAMQYCQRDGGVGCTLFMVDHKLVYPPR